MRSAQNACASSARSRPRTCRVEKLRYCLNRAPGSPIGRQGAGQAAGREPRDRESSFSFPMAVGGPHKAPITACRWRRPRPRTRCAAKSPSLPARCTISARTTPRPPEERTQPMFSRYKKSGAKPRTKGPVAERSQGTGPRRGTSPSPRSSHQCPAQATAECRRPPPAARGQGAQAQGTARRDQARAAPRAAGQSQPRRARHRVRGRPARRDQLDRREGLARKGIVLNREDRSTLTQELYDEVKGLGPLETLLQDDGQRHPRERPQADFRRARRRLELSDVTFKDEKHLLRIIDKIVSAVGRRVDESNPYVDARLAGRLAFQRDGPADRGRRLARLDPEIQEGQARHRRSGEFRRLLRGNGGLSAGRRVLPPQRHRLRRDGLGQDHDAQRAVVLHREPSAS